VGDRLDEILEAFVATPWGHLGATQSTAEGMCKRVSLALLATLEREDMGGQLWNMAGLKAPEWGGPGYGQHYVVEVDGEALDVTARQFAPDNPYPLREPLEDSHARWDSGHPVNPDDAWSQRFTEYITPRWRELPDVAPPGDELGWPVPPGGPAS
jgi:hypothetical protein